MMLRMLPFRGSALVLQSYCFNASDVGAVTRIRWHDAHAKQRKAEVWNSFFQLLLIEGAANQCFTALRPFGTYYKPRTSVFSASFPQSTCYKHILNGYLWWGPILISFLFNYKI